MPRRTSPENRATANKTELAKVRRRYKKDLDKPRKLLPGDEEALGYTTVVFKLAGYSNTQIAKVVGISKGQVKQFLETPRAQQLLVELRENLTTAALDLLHGLMIEAVVTLGEIMRKSEDDKIVLSAIQEILDRGGMPKASRQERLNENTENISISDDGLVERLREASPEIQEKAALLVEELEQLTLEAASGEAEEPDGA